ncbi:MAG: hypothetical protein Fur007_12810 [Rhodoferax sp.]
MAAQPDWRQVREALPQQIALGPLRIRYDPAGAAAFSADRAAALAQQLQRAQAHYTDTLGLTPPWRSARLPTVRTVDVHVLAVPQAMGQAGDAPIAYRYADGAIAQPALSIAIAHRWQPGNLTPEHELFHSYQYGYSFFKNAWYLEGLARAMQADFESRPARTQPLPADAQTWTAFLAGSYNTAPIWNRLRLLCDPACREPSKGALPRACAASWLRSLLLAMGEQDQRAAQARGIPPNAWPEAEQRSPANVPFMVEALVHSVQSSCPVADSTELQTFVALAPR